MTTGSHGAGTLLAGRYRFEDLLTEHDGAHFWRATDTVLARSVAIHAVPSDDPRAAAPDGGGPALGHRQRLPPAARARRRRRRRARLGGQRVGRGPLARPDARSAARSPPERAAWLTREVAEAVAAGHRQGVAHGRLNPEAVLVTHAGGVKLIGYVVDASLRPARDRRPGLRRARRARADVINLGGMLYASLTGRWPGVAPSAVPAAPRESHRPLRPRQVRAGVPRVARRHLRPGAAAARAPTTAASRPPTRSPPRWPTSPAASGPSSPWRWPRCTTSRPSPSRPPDAPTQAPRPTAAEPTRVRGPRRTTAAERPRGHPALRGRPDGRPDPAMEHTALHREPLEGPDSLRPMRAPDVVPPPPPFEDSPERPLFSTTERRVPGGRRRHHEPTERWDDPHRLATGRRPHRLPPDRHPRAARRRARELAVHRRRPGAGPGQRARGPRLAAHRRGRRGGAGARSSRWPWPSRWAARTAACSAASPAATTTRRRPRRRPASALEVAAVERLRPRGRPRRREPRGGPQRHRRRPRHRLDHGDLPQPPRPRRPQGRRRPDARPRRATARSAR